MTVFLVAAAGLLLIASGLRDHRRRRRFDAECRTFGCHDWPPESDGLDIPEWVNDGRFFDDFVKAVHFAQWEQELED
jgi:hypothetical protein